MTVRRSLLLALPVLAALALTAACNNNADARPGAAAANGSAAGKFTAPEYVMGSPTAKVTVTEYLSNTCSHCAHFDETFFPEIKKQFLDTGKVKWVVREFLTPPEQVAAPGFVLARCAGRDKYWGVIESLFAAQKEMFAGTPPRDIFVRIAKGAGLSEAQMNACLADDQAYKDLDARFRKAVEGPDKVSGTPAFFVNGKELKAGETLAGERFNGTDLDVKKFAAAYANAGGR